MSHPGVSIGGAELPFRNVSAIPFPGDKFVFSELNVNIILDEDMNAYLEVFNWLKRVVEEPNKVATDRNSNDIPSFSDLTLNILSSHNNVTKKIRYIDAIPSALGNIELESTSGGTEFLTCPVSFRFSYFEVL